MNPLEWFYRSIAWLLANGLYEVARIGELWFWIFDKLSDLFSLIVHHGGHCDFTPLRPQEDEE